MDWLLSRTSPCGFLKPQCAPSHTTELVLTSYRHADPYQRYGSASLNQSCHRLSARVTRPGSLVCALPSPGGTLSHTPRSPLHTPGGRPRLHRFEMPRHTGTDRLNPVPIRSSRLDLPVPVTSGHRTGCPNGGHTVTVTSPLTF